MANTKLQGKAGVYILRNTKSGHFYCGSSGDLYNRFKSHQSALKAGDAPKKLQEAHDTTGATINDWEMEIVEECNKRHLNRKETMWIKKYITDPLCCNSRMTAQSGKRGTTINQQTKLKYVDSMLGQNTKDGRVHRPYEVIFVSPYGEEHKVISVNGFCKENNLSQSSFTQLANGVSTCANGWTVKNQAELPPVGRVFPYWPDSRLRKYYKEHIIIGPDGTRYEHFSLYHFEQEHNCTVVQETNESSGELGARHYIKGLTDEGRGYYIDDPTKVQLYRIVYKGITYDNILSPRRWAMTHNVSHLRFIRYLKNPPVYRRQFHIEKM